MKYIEFISINVLIYSIMASMAIAKPLSLRGVDWSMSRDEQITNIEKNGLKCITESGWDGHISPAETINSKPVTMCFVEDGAGADIATLRNEFNNWYAYCPTTSSPLRACSGHQFHKLKDRLLRVRFKDSGSIIFQCEYFESCTYPITEVVKQLQRQVINADFWKPTEDSYVTCATGEDGDQVCVHLISRAIWLFQNPDEGTIKF